MHNENVFDANKDIIELFSKCNEVIVDAYLNYF